MSTDTAAATTTNRPESAATMRRVLLCRVTSRVMARLRATEDDVEDTAAAALARGLDVVRTELDGASGADGRARGAELEDYAAGYRPLAVPVSQPLFGAVLKVALDRFGGETRAAAGWLMARGVGIPMGLPGAPRRALPKAASDTNAAGVRRPVPPVVSVPAARLTPAPTGERQAEREPRRPRARAAGAAVEVDAPTGAELRAAREELGISQRDLAVAAGLSRGLVAEVERGRRANALTRLRLAETMRAMARST